VLWLYYTEWFSFIYMLWPVILDLGCANTVVLSATYAKHKVLAG
jgi:hypothetical protein